MRCAVQSSFARSIRSRRDDTKFHQMNRGPSSGAPPTTTKRPPRGAPTCAGAPGASTASTGNNTTTATALPTLDPYLVVAGYIVRT